MYLLLRSSFSFLFCVIFSIAQAQDGKNSFNNDLEFHSDHIIYKGKKITIVRKPWAPKEILICSGVHMEADIEKTILAALDFSIPELLRAMQH
jgi:hypothetical protein